MFFPTAIKSIQVGSIDLNNVTSNTATITSVNTASAILLRRGDTHALVGNNNDTNTYTLVLTNATTVTASRFTGEASAFPCGFTVIEFVPGLIKSVQAGTIQLNGGTSATATISSVNTAKSWVIDLGFKYNNAAPQNASLFDRLLVLTNATTVTASIVTNPAASHISSFMVVEFN